MSTELATKPKNEIRSIIESDKFKNEVARVLPSHLKPERFVRIAITATTRTPKLLQTTPASLLKCLLDLSALGLEPDGRRAHLIPYGTECTLIIDWKGLAELAMRSGIVSVLHADVVCEHDTFEYDRGQLASHKVNFKEPRGSVYAVYALCRFKDGNEKCDVMTLDEVKAIQKRSRSGSNGPWVTDFNEMAKKTVFRRLSKWLPLSAEFRDALDADGDTLTESQLPEKVAIGRVVKADAEPFKLPESAEATPEPEAPEPEAQQSPTDESQEPVTDAPPEDQDALVKWLAAKSEALAVTEKDVIEHCRQKKKCGTAKNFAEMPGSGRKWLAENFEAVAKDIRGE